jgi:putative ABC transport system ATP-binding protein
VNETTPTPAIEAIDLVKSFDRGVVRALDGVTLTIADCEYVAVTGPSGGGKSTFLHCVAALTKADSGVLRVHGIDVNRLHDENKYRREQIGLVFQLHDLLPHLSALQNIEIAMLGTGLHRHQQRERARELLDAVDLGGREKRRPPELSGGERQRVAIARALANHPRVLLADEPTGSLDTRSVVRVLDLLGRLRETEHVTIVVVTHDPTVAATTDRIIHLQDGRVVDEAMADAQSPGLT